MRDLEFPRIEYLPELRIQNYSQEAAEPDGEPDQVGSGFPTSAILTHSYPRCAPKRNCATAGWVQIAAHGGRQPLSTENQTMT